MQPKHILITGEVGIGKSTLIRKLLDSRTLPQYGFITKRLASDETGFHPIYIHSAEEKPEKWVWTEDNCVGTCNRIIHNINLDVFNTLGAQYIRSARQGGIIVMDELGFMEAEADAFTDAVFAALDGDIPVIAAVKSRTDVPFLNRLRAHKNAAVYWIASENRDYVCQELLPIVQAWQQK